MINFVVVLICSAIIGFFALLYFSQLDSTICGIIAAICLITFFISIFGWIALQMSGEKVEEISVAKIKSIKSIESHSYMYHGEKIEFDMIVDANGEDAQCFVYYPVSFEDQERLEKHIHKNNDEHANEVIRTNTHYELGIFTVPDFAEIFNNWTNTETSNYEIYLSQEDIERIPGYENLNIK